MARYKLLTFDVTNTLLKLRVSPGIQYARIGKLYGVDADPEKLSASFKNQWKILSIRHPNFGSGTDLSYQQWWSEMVRRTFLDSQPQLSSDTLEKISSHLIEMYGSSSCWEVREGAKDTLKKLRHEHSNVSLGVISNFDTRLHQILQQTELSPFFDFVLASYDCGHYKPRANIFELALQTTKCLPKEAVHVGDNFELDYQAAKNAGWNAVLFDPNKNEKRENVTRIQNLREIIEII